MIATLVAASALFSPAPQQAIGSVPFVIAESAMIIDATVNGATGSFMFDTGFSGSFVIGEDLDIGPSTGTMTLRDFVGSFEAKTTKIKSLKIGDQTIAAKDKEVVQMAQGNMTESYGVHTSGIMGLEVFADQTFEINFQKQKVFFYPKTYDISTRKPDGVKTFLLRMLPMGNNSVELPVVTPAGKKFTLALDTGNAFYATTYKETLEEAGLWPAGKKVEFAKQSFVASGAVPSFSVYLPDMKIFGVPVKESVWDIIDVAAGSADSHGTVGFGFLRNFNVTIDMARRRVWLELTTADAGNKLEGDIGVTAGYWADMKRVVVFNVTPGSPADKAGIRGGDSLLSLNGIEMQTESYRQMRTLLDGDPGTKVKIVTSRGGVLARHELTREVLVNLAPKRTTAPVGGK